MDTLVVEAVTIALAEGGKADEEMLRLVHTPFAFLADPWDKNTLCVKVTHVPSGCKLPFGWDQLLDAIADVRTWWMELTSDERLAWMEATTIEDSKSLKDSAKTLRAKSHFNFTPEWSN